MIDPEITEELIAAHGIKPDEYQSILEIIGRTPTKSSGHLFGHVERALLVQVFQAASEETANNRAAGDLRTGRECGHCRYW